MAKAGGAGLMCRHCGKPARRERKPGLSEEEQKAVHEGSGEEPCEGNSERLAAPIDPNMTSWDMVSLS